MSRTLIIAEAGVNHNGDMSLAHDLIDAAADAGADLVKFQTFSADRLTTLNAEKAAYQMADGVSGESQYSMLRRLELSADMHADLLGYCNKRGIGFFSTGFDRESLDFLVELGISFIKVPSGEVTNLPYLRHAGQYGKRILLSTGMARLGEIEAAIDVLEQAGTVRGQITVLHCTTEYPAPMRDVNLRAMISMRDAFGVAVGYSDHTLGIEVPVAAVSLGATVIEKHFTMDRALPGPDHKASLEPSGLKDMVNAIRNIELALGDGVKRLTEGEEKNKSAARKSIVAATVIHSGEILSENNLTVKRPGTGISPMRWDEVLGRRAIRDFMSDESIVL